MAAVPLRVVSAHTTSDRRVSPDWTVAQLKARLEPITGVPIEHQRLVLHGEDLHVEDEEGTLLGSLGLVPQSELQVRHASGDTPSLPFRTLCSISRCPRLAV
jgi:tubulin-specific chaperone B